MSLLKFEPGFDPDASGVYRIYLKLPNEDEVTLYIGKSNNLLRRSRDYSGTPKFYRTKDPSKLDTRMVVHCLLRFLQEKGHDCYFEHLDWDPDEENMWVKKLTPTLQRLEMNAGHLTSHYYLGSADPEYWSKSAGVDDAQRRDEARRRLFKLFEDEQWPLIQSLCPYFSRASS